ncbi:MAG: hypothetical protein FJX23_03815 [Alphaproteobacteria bacterium]|nr:hypothetical protein [Alphaproteobacteria bacterium]
MDIHNASLMLLKIGDDGAPTEAFHTIGGLRATRVSIGRNPPEVRDVSGNGWKRMLEGAGIASLRISGQGVAATKEGDARLWQRAVDGASRNYRIHLADGGRIDAKCVVTGYERTGAVEGLEGFTLTLESSGAVTYTA